MFHILKEWLGSQSRNGYILQGEELQRYAETRLFGRNIGPNMVEKIELHNGLLPSELLARYTERGVALQAVIQENAREPLFFHDGTLHIPQYSGFGRAHRYERLIARYAEEHKPELAFQAFPVRRDARRARNKAYEKLACDHAAHLYATGALEGVRHIILGDAEAMALQTSVEQELSTEYLDTNLLAVNGFPVLNLGYVYADQASILLDQILLELDTSKNAGDVYVYMFGRFGGVNKSFKRQALVTPTRIMRERDMRQGNRTLYEFPNILYNGSARNVNMNVKSVVDETYEALEQAAYFGVDSIDMESLATMLAIEEAKNRYSEEYNIHFGLVGYISDVPLLGDTLADELECDKGEQAAVTRILEDICDDKLHKQFIHKLRKKA